MFHHNLDGDGSKGNFVRLKEMNNSYVDEFSIEGHLDASTGPS
jgi:hypothetical protein